MDNQSPLHHVDILHQTLHSPLLPPLSTRNSYSALHVGDMVRYHHYHLVYSYHLRTSHRIMYSRVSFMDALRRNVRSNARLPLCLANPNYQHSLRQRHNERTHRRLLRPPSRIAIYANQDNPPPTNRHDERIRHRFPVSFRPSSCPLSDLTHTPTAS